MALYNFSFGMSNIHIIVVSLVNDIMLFICGEGKEKKSQVRQSANRWNISCTYDEIGIVHKKSNYVYVQCTKLEQTTPFNGFLSQVSSFRIIIC